MCDEAESGVHINYNNENIVNKICAIVLGSQVKGGVQINNGAVNSIGLRSKKGVQINNGIKKYGESFSHEHTQRNTITVSTRINNGKILDNILTYEIDMHHPSRSHLKQKLDEKLKDIDFLKNLPDLLYEEQIQKVEAFDFNKFEKEITEIAEEIKNHS